MYSFIRKYSFIINICFNDIIIRNIILGILYGTIFFNLCTDSSDQNCYTYRFSLLFVVIMNQFIIHLYCIRELFVDRLVFYRERGVKAYGAFPYWLSLTIPILLFQLPILLIFSLLVYFLAGLRDGHFGVFFLILLLSNYVCLYISYLCGAVSSSTQVALNIFPIVLGLNMLYAGFLIYIPELPGVEGRWLPYIFYRYAYQGLVLNELQDNNDLSLSHSYISELGFDNLSVTGCTSIILLFLIFLGVCFYMALRFIDFEQR